MFHGQNSDVRYFHSQVSQVILQNGLLTLQAIDVMFLYYIVVEEISIYHSFSACYILQYMLSSPVNLWDLEVLEHPSLLFDPKCNNDAFRECYKSLKN